MLIVNILAILSSFGHFVCGKLEIIENLVENHGKLMKFLINQVEFLENADNMMHDVVLLNMVENKNWLVDEFVSEIATKYQKIVMTANEKDVRKIEIRKGGLIIIFCNTLDKVRSFILLFIYFKNFYYHFTD